jgi:glycolate oxidase FAD binding subunit
MAIAGRPTIADAALRTWGPAARVAEAGATGLPAVTLEPPDLPTLSAMLQWANTDGVRLGPRGRGTKWGWGCASAPVDAALSTLGLNTPIDHCPGDLTATLPAGATLAEVNGLLGRERQRLPLDPHAADRATIGGIVATNDSGPSRLGHGGPRDLIIGIGMALADGRIAKAGGRVVKNVAGYDLARMLCGSLGSLAVITTATFKLAPAPRASRTVVAQPEHAGVLGQLTLALLAKPTSPAAMELTWPPGELLIRFQTTERAAEDQAAQVLQVCRAHRVRASIAAGAEEDALWRTHAARAGGTDRPGATIKISILPTAVGDAVAHAERAASSRGVDWLMYGRAALGVLYVHLRDNDVDRVAEVIADLRRHAASHRGSAVALHGPPGLAQRIEPWGDLGNAFATMQAIKARFDPNGVLNPGRGPGGL